MYAASNKDFHLSKIIRNNKIPFAWEETMNDSRLYPSVIRSGIALWNSENFSVLPKLFSAGKWITNERAESEDFRPCWKARCVAKRGKKTEICRCNACSDRAIKCTQALDAGRTVRVPSGSIKNAVITFRQRLRNLQTISPSLSLSPLHTLRSPFFPDRRYRSPSLGVRIAFKYSFVTLWCNRSPPEKLPSLGWISLATRANELAGDSFGRFQTQRRLRTSNPVSFLYFFARDFG